MGIKENVGFDQFPKQSAKVGKCVSVAFNYDFKHLVEGTIVRDDIEAPYEVIIALDDGRYVRSVECQYSHPG